MQGHHLSGTACALDRGTADGSDGSLLPGLWSHSLAAAGPRVALPLPIVPSWGWAVCQRFTAVAESVTHFTGVTAGAVPANAPADVDVRDTPIFVKQGEAGGWIAACLCPLNTGVWAHKMEEGISLLLIQSRGLLLDLLPLRRWLLSLGCSMFLGRVLLPLE